MQELSLKEIQEETLKTFLKLKEICAQLNIKCFLVFGTLLGAIRHKGFIPWDDDLDVMMTRNDFERLVDFLEKNKDNFSPYKICTRGNTKNYTCSNPRFTDTSFVFKSSYKYEKPFEQGVFVDIYLLDVCGNSANQVHYLNKKIRRLDKFYIIYNNPNNGKKDLKCLIRYFVSIFLHFTWGFNFDIDAKIKRVLSKNTSGSDDFVAILSEKICVPIRKDLLSKCQEKEFEGERAFVLPNYEELLENEYGDYMRLPDESERTPHHNYSIFKNS